MDEHKTPKIVHFIYISEHTKDFWELPVIYYLAIQSVVLSNPSYTIWLHTNLVLRGDLFDRIAGVIAIKQVVLPVEIFGNPISRVQHKADVLRLQILHENGGVYLDLDTFTI